MRDDNLMHVLAAGGAVLVGLLLCAGAWGHLDAVLPIPAGIGTSSFGDRFLLLFPGIVLASVAATNILLSKFLWNGRRWALQSAFTINLVALLYFSYLLLEGVPDHPIGVFVAAVASYVLVLGATGLGLVWPADRRQ